MGIILALFIFQQTASGGYADTTWPMYGATLENMQFQRMKGYMKDSVVVKWKFVTGSSVEAYGSAIADVDGDDTMEVVIGSMDNKVYCLNGITGLPEWEYTTGAYVVSSPAVADVDGDDTVEVVIGSGDNKVYCLNGLTGIPEWEWTTGDCVESSPAIADVDGDGAMEVVIGSYDSTLYCLNGITGLPEWEYAIGGNSSPAVADVDKDDTLEVVVGSGDYKVYCLNGATGVVEWSYTTGGLVWSSPAVADVDGDDTMEVVVGNQDYKVYCLNGVSGVMEWSHTTGNEVTSSPAVADVDGDDTLEVVIGSHDKKVYCLNGVTGDTEWTYTAPSLIHRSIAVCDLDMDDKLEVLVPNANTDSLICLNGEDGSELWVKELANDVHDPVVGDIDNDGCVEIVVGTAVDNAVWALDDPDDHSGCGSGHGVEESEKLEVRSEIEFKQMGNSIYLFNNYAQEIDLRVYDICGRLRQVLYKGVLSKGGHTFIPNIEVSGIYFIVLKGQGFRESVKLINLVY